MECPEWGGTHKGPQGSDKVTLSETIPGSTAGALHPSGGKTPPNPAGVSLQCRRGGLTKCFLGETETAYVTHVRFESATPKSLFIPTATGVLKFAILLKFPFLVGVY